MKRDPAGDILLDVGGRRLWAASDVPLAEGTRLQVEVAKAGTVVELRIRGGGGSAGKAADMLPRLLNALESIEPGRTGDQTPSLASALARLRTGAATLLGTDGAAALDAALGRLVASGRASDVARAVRGRVEQGGLLWERHVRELLESGVAPEAIAGRLRRDLRVLLGRLTSAARSAADAGPGGGLAEVARLSTAVGDQLLDRQIEAAVRWVRDGELSLELPISLLGEETTAKVVLIRDRDRGGKRRREGETPSRVEVRLETLALGHVLARISWNPTQATALVAVDRLETRDLLSAHLPEFAGRLSALGIATAQVEVVFDPVAATAPVARAASPATRGGALFDVKV